MPPNKLLLDMDMVSPPEERRCAGASISAEGRRKMEADIRIHDEVIKELAEYGFIQSRDEYGFAVVSCQNEQSGVTVNVFRGEDQYHYNVKVYKESNRGTLNEDIGSRTNVYEEEVVSNILLILTKAEILRVI